MTPAALKNLECRRDVEPRTDLASLHWQETALQQQQLWTSVMRDNRGGGSGDGRWVPRKGAAGLPRECWRLWRNLAHQSGSWWLGSVTLMRSSTLYQTAGNQEQYSGQSMIQPCFRCQETVRRGEGD